MTSTERFEQRITELRVLLAECRRWHHGDPWRYAVDARNKQAWQDQEDRIAAELDKPAVDANVCEH